MSEIPAFSLVLGGPWYRFCQWTGLVRPPVELVHRRIFAAVAFTWVPMLLLSVTAHQAVSGTTVPFLLDLDVQARFLLTLPLLIISEVFAQPVIRNVVGEFTRRGLVAAENLGRFESVVVSSIELTNSNLVEFALLAFAVWGGQWLWRQDVATHVATWYGAQGGDGRVHLTPAGYWHAYVALPLVRFLVLRWVYRLVIWYRFVWRVSRIPLRLNPLHSDLAGGLGFIDQSIYGFGPLVLAQSVLLSSVIADRILFEGAKLMDQQVDLIVVPIFLMVLVLTPLTFFVMQLGEAKIRGRLEFGRLASRYVTGFREKWLSGAAEREELVGTSDIQSLADLTNSFEVVRRMRWVPLGRDTLLTLAVQIVLPLLPLGLTVVPLNDILDSAIKVLI